MIEDIKWYIHITERNIYNYIDNMIYKVKTQIAGREILKYPKLSSWHLMGFTNKELEQIKAAAEEVQASEDEYLEEESWQAIKNLFKNAEANTNDMHEYLEKELRQAV